MDCIFCKIARKEVGTLIYEDEQCVGVMDANPLSRGHMLIIPKYHAEYLTEMPDAYLLNILIVIKKIISKLGTIDSYNILQNNKNMQSIKHVHFHIIPYDEQEKEGLIAKWSRSKVSSEEIHLHGEAVKKILSGTDNTKTNNQQE